MKRQLWIVAALVTGGVLVNTAVAWGCALWSPMRVSRSLSAEEAGAILRAEFGAYESWSTPQGVLNGGMGWTLIVAVDQRLAIWDTRGRTGRGASRGLSFMVMPALRPGDPNDKNMHVMKAGWPLLCWMGERTSLGGTLAERSLATPPPLIADLGIKPLRKIPLRPAWGAMAADMVFWSLVLWLLVLGPFVARRYLRRRRGQCAGCGYDVRGDIAGGCPECGLGR